ncbi:MAG: FAD-binding oxidoreductase, partial [Sneathiellales bacterium]|nr:FAD-binding oxidoreductase [Sneathiellales bacterium]
MQELVNRLQDIVGPAHVLQSKDVTSRHCDYCEGAYGADLLVRPENTDELAKVVELANDEERNIVAHGGMTGLVAGTTSEKGDLIISFERMNKVLRVDGDQNVLIAEAGTTLETIINAAAEIGMMPGVDIPSRGSATIGGMTSTNAGGVRVLRYGMMRENILGLEAVMQDGTILKTLNTLMKNNAGFDLKQLFIGTEGRLG